MRVAIPTTGDEGRAATVATHFGRTAGITVVDTETDETTFVPHEGGHGAGGNPPPFTIFETDASTVVAGDIGRGAVARLRDEGLTVYRGAEGTVAEALEQLAEDELTAVEPEDVHGHGEGHEHGHGHDDDEESGLSHEDGERRRE